MDRYDVSLQVLYDFEYTTKDGRNIKIVSGERLLLVKRTNNDWWQVIRSSETRPFYAPASYVKEINKAQSSSHIDQTQIAPSAIQLSTNSHPNSLKQITNSLKPINLKDAPDTGPEVSSIPDLCEENLLTSSKHLDETNIFNGPRCSSGSRKKFGIVDSYVLDSDLSPGDGNELITEIERPQNNLASSKNHINCNIDSGACRLIVGNTPVSVPSSESLENLSLQIEMKTSTFINRSPGKCIQSLDSGIVENISENDLQEQESVLLQDIVDNDKEIQDNFKGKHNLKVKPSSSYESVCIKPPSYLNQSSLQYRGSFKTVSERQRMFKLDIKGNEKDLLFSCSEGNYIDSAQNQEESETSPLPEDISSDSLCTVNSTHTQICSVANKSTSKDSNKTKNSLQKNELNAKYFGSDSQLSQIKKISRERTNSRQSLDSVVEGELIAGLEQNKLKNREYYSLDSNVDLVNSEKSSTDSLLDIENNQNYRKISGGTTSDSIVPTDGEDLPSSGSELGLNKFAKRKQVGVRDDLPKRKPLLRRQRVELQSEHCNDQEGNANAGELFVVSVELPTGWQSSVDPVSGQTCYINNATGMKWFSSNDGEGRLYFFEENSNQSSWTLPKHDLLDLKEKTSGLEQKTPPNNGEGLLINPVSEKNLGRKQKSKSGFDLRHESSVSSLSSQNWPQLWEGHMAILKEGPLNKTKITENGKRLRKNWTTMHAVLTELLLLFFKDNKGYPAMLSGSGHPELSVDLNGAKIDNGDKMSSRHNVYLLSTVLGLQVLIQSDCAMLAAEWLIKIQSAIDNLPSSSISVKGPRLKPDTPPNETKSSALVRSKSIKSKQKSVSIEDLSNTNVSERQTKIKERLKRFFHMRPSVEILVKKGILKDEPVFGCVLEQTCSPVEPRVPRIVLECIRCIERSSENMKTDGLYRASGNLSQVQKIRCQVDQHQYGLLDLEEDVHVLTGTLKLFFRELKQPIIPFKFFKKALNASTNQNRNEKIKHFQEIVKSLPPCNHDTLKCLIQHLLRVTQFQEFNRMHIPNIAIVFGPTLMWPEQESQNMACDLMQQNLVIECLLSDFSLIFR